MNRRQRVHRGFIFVFFGSRGIVSDDSSAPPIKQRCPRCGRDTELFAKRYRQWFTIFFIPIFPMSPPRKFIQCGNCGAQFPQKADAACGIPASEAEQAQFVIGLYNSLRASPANSITLNAVMMAYASMKEYDQAISAAADFPQALNASEQCMTTLARVYLAENKFAEALQWLGAAIERNPQLGEAQYYKAVVHMLATPPDVSAAISAARAARNAGYPGADELLRQAEEKAREAV